MANKADNPQEQVEKPVESKEKPATQHYYFPHLERSIEATSREEALKQAEQVDAIG